VEHISEGHSSVFVIQLRAVATIRNGKDTKASGIENSVKIVDFLTPQNLAKGSVKCSLNTFIKTMWHGPIFGRGHSTSSDIGGVDK